MSDYYHSASIATICFMEAKVSSVFGFNFNHLVSSLLRIHSLSFWDDTDRDVQRPSCTLFRNLEFTESVSE